jgi:hypothetical protein
MNRRGSGTSRRVQLGLVRNLTGGMGGAVAIARGDVNCLQSSCHKAGAAHFI